MVTIETSPHAPSVALNAGKHRQPTQHHGSYVISSESDAVKPDWVGMCAHDLRNPLSSVCGLADFLLDPALGSLNSEQIQIVDSIQEASHSMLKLVNLLLDKSMMEAGKMRLSLAPSCLRDFSKRAIFLAAVVAVRKGTRIVLQPQTSDEPLLMIDEIRIREVVDNLLGNAVKFSPSGSLIKVTIEALAACADDPPCMRFSVCDQGPGIPAEERDLLFRDFSRLSASPTGGEKAPVSAWPSAVK